MVDKKLLLDINIEMLTKGEPVDIDYVGYNKADFYKMSKYIDLNIIDDFGYLDMLQRLKKYTKTQIKDYKDEILNSLDEFKSIHGDIEETQILKFKDILVNYNYEENKSLIYCQGFYWLSKLAAKSENVDVLNTYSFSIDSRYLYSFLNMCIKKKFNILGDITTVLENKDDNLLDTVFERELKQMEEGEKREEENLIRERMEEEYRNREKERKLNIAKENRALLDSMIKGCSEKFENSLDSVYLDLIDFEIDNNTYKLIIVPISDNFIFELNQKELMDMFSYKKDRSFYNYFSSKECLDKGIIPIQVRYIGDIENDINKNLKLIESCYCKKFDFNDFSNTISKQGTRSKVKLSLIDNAIQEYFGYEDDYFICEFGYDANLVDAIRSFLTGSRVYIYDKKVNLIKFSKLNQLVYLIENCGSFLDIVGYQEILDYVNEKNIKLSKVVDGIILLDIPIVDRGTTIEIGRLYDYKLQEIISNYKESSKKYKGIHILKENLSSFLYELIDKEINKKFDISEIKDILSFYESDKLDLSINYSDSNYLRIKAKHITKNLNVLLNEFGALDSEDLIIDRSDIEIFRKRLDEYKFKVNNEFENEIIAFNNSKKEENNIIHKALPKEYFLREPYEYQYEILDEMLNLKRFLLCDEMGIGKTFEAIMFASCIPFNKLIVAPASLTYNWEKEILKTVPNANVTVVDSKSKLNNINDLGTNEWFVLNYELIGKYEEYIKRQDFKVFICDEAHYIKGVNNDGVPTSRRAKNVLEIANKIPYKVAITGTPVNNKPKDIWNLLKFINSKEILIGFDKFKCFCEVNRELSLHKILKDKMIRRLKREILTLPNITRTFIPTKINISKYTKSLKEYLDLDIRNINVFIAYLNTLRYILATEKVKSTIGIAETIINDGSKVVIFTNFTEPAKKIKEHFKDKAILLDGSIPTNKRNELVENFQEGNANIFISNLKSGGVGITLHKANVVIFNDFDYVPANHLQAEERIHRIGQDKECSIIYNYANNANIDTFVADKLEFKFNVISKIVDNIDTDFIGEKEDSNIVEDLFELLK